MSYFVICCYCFIIALNVYDMLSMFIVMTIICACQMGLHISTALNSHNDFIVNQYI